MKRIIEIEDILDELVENTIEEVKELLIEYLESNFSDDPTTIPQEFELFDKLNYDSSIHEIIDNAVPIYDSDIKDIMYLHGDKIEAAFENAGIGDKSDNGWPRGWKAAAIYTYIEEKVIEWFYSDAKEIINEWQERIKK